MTAAQTGLSNRQEQALVALVNLCETYAFTDAHGVAGQIIREGMEDASRLSVAGVGKALSKLAEMGLVEREWQGAAWQYEPTYAGRRLCRSMGD